MKNARLKSKKKVKLLFIKGVLLFQISQPLASCTSAVLMPLPVPISRLSEMKREKILTDKTSHVKIATIIRPIINEIDLTNQQIEDLNIICSQLDNGSITLNEAILKIRGKSLYEWAFVIIIILVWQTQNMTGFVPQLPHLDPHGWATGRYRQHKPGSQSTFLPPPSGVEKEIHAAKQLAIAAGNEDEFKMSHEAAVELVSKTYPGSTQITEDCKVSD